jgi:2-polyprenyl-3-methyl-5-hydroxy-6-metoxy-1,4-benzoquinol methylase
MSSEFIPFQDCSSDFGSKHILEGRIPPEVYLELAKAVTAGWGVASDFDYSGPEVDAVVFKRHDNTVRFVAPFLSSFLNVSKSSIMDFGCGCGSSSLGLSHFFEKVNGLEIDEPSVNGFMKRMSVFGVSNTKIVSDDPENLKERALKDLKKNDAILLLAVVEHLTEAEQKDYLSSFWKALRPGQSMIILETPNYLAAHDSHTFGIPFAHTVPDMYYLKWLSKQDENLRFRSDILSNYYVNGEDSALLQRRRLGLAFNPLLLELILEVDVNEVIVQDGFADPMLDWFPLNSDDLSLIKTFDEHSLKYPIGFARSVLSLALRKPKNKKDAEAIKNANFQRREKTLETFRS